MQANLQSECAGRLALIQNSKFCQRWNLRRPRKLLSPGAVVSFGIPRHGHSFTVAGNRRAVNRTAVDFPIVLMAGLGELQFP